MCTAYVYVWLVAVFMKTLLLTGSPRKAYRLCLANTPARERLELAAGSVYQRWCEWVSKRGRGFAMRLLMGTGVTDPGYKDVPAAISGS